MDEDDVCGLNVPMHQTMSVKLREAAHHVEGDTDAMRNRKPSAGLEFRAQCPGLVSFDIE